MNVSSISSVKFWVIAGVGIVAVGATVWGLSRRTDQDAPTLPQELSVETLQAQADEPGKLMGTARDTLRREDLTDEQRRQALRNMREVWRSTLTDRMEEYFDASPEEKVAVLDQHIDQLQARMKEWEKRRDESEEDGDRERFRNLFGQMSQQQRKARSESINPDRTARALAYFSAVRSRMAERGIKMPQGRGRLGARGRRP